MKKYREQMETMVDFIFLVFKSLWMVTAATKLKHSFSLVRRKPMTYLDSILENRHHFANKSAYCQSYDFSSSHLQMWELDHKNG